MNKSLRRRVAAVATTATVGGLLLPFLAAGSAAAAGATALTVSPATAYTTTSAATTFTGSITGSAAPSTDYNGAVYAYAFSGPDAGTSSAACAITGAAAPYAYSCSFPAGANPGVDSMRIFYNPGKTATYSPSFVQATASLSVAGPLNKVVLTPVISSASVAQGNFAAYTVTATDAGNRPFPGAIVNVTSTQTNTANTDLSGSATAPAAPGYLSPTTASPTTANPVGSNGPVATTTGNGTGGSVAGVATYYVASRVVGSVNINVATTVNGVSASGILTVNGGSANDVTSVTAAPSKQRGFPSDTAAVVFNATNLQGNAVVGLQPVLAVISGPDTNATITPAPTSGLTDTNGNVTATYPVATNAAPGNDVVQGYVNQLKNGNTGSLDPGELSAQATVAVAAFDVNAITSSPSATTAPLSTKTSTIVYTVANGGASLAGYTVNFSKVTPQGTFVLGATSAVTDAKGKVSVTVTNAAPGDGDNATITAKVGTTANKTASSTVTYAASTVSSNTLKIAPFANTTAATGSATFSVSATDQFGNAVTGLSYNWTVSGRNNAANNGGYTGTLSTFTYKDALAANTAGTDTVTVTATTPGNVVYSTVANQYWVATTGIATQANIDLGDGAGTYNGSYAPNQTGVPAGQTGPIVASNFTKAATTGVTSNPAPGATQTPYAVLVGLTDAANNRLFGKSVSFSSSGVGVFTDVSGNPIGTSTTALVADQNANNRDVTPAGAATGSTTVNSATVFVRSTQGGTQTITATVDGITTNATVTYTGQYVGITPFRVLNTSTGQGAITTTPGTGGSSAPAGPLAADTSYYFNYAATGIPVNASAYAFNVTAISPNGLGNLRVAPGTGVAVAPPTTSLVNYQPGKDVANLVIVPNGVGVPGANTLQLFSAAASANVAIDLVGYYASGAGISTTAPARIADTGNGNGGSTLAAGETRAFQVAGAFSNFATTAKAVALNVTARNPGGLGNLRIFADGAALPTTSNINYIPGQDKSAFVIVNLPTNGKIDVYSAGSPVDVVIDAYASYDQTTSNLVTQTPVRILDSRGGSTLAAGGSGDVQVTGLAGVPVDAQAVLVSVTSVHTLGSTGSGNLRVYPTGGSLPNISTLNYVSPTADVANFAIVKLGANGRITVNTQGSPTDVLVDVVGYVPAGG